MGFTRKDFCSGESSHAERSFEFNILNILHNDLESDEEDGKKYTIHLFGVTKFSETVYVKVLGYTPFFYIKVPETWNIAHAQLLVDAINKNRDMYPYKNSIVSWKIMMKGKYRGYDNHKKYKFLRLVFESHGAMRKCMYMFNNFIEVPGLPTAKYETYESNIEPVLRFIHLREINPTGWIRVSKVSKLSSEESTCMFNFAVHWTNVEPIKNDTIAPYIACAFDIECISMTGGFPKPNRPGDAIITIGTTFRKYGDKESCLIVVHSLKPCPEIPGAVIVNCKTEKELLLSWRDLLQHMDPDFIYGYNSNGFDFTYIHQRAIVNKIEKDFMQLSRLSIFPAKFVEKKLASSALGDNTHRFIDMHGRCVLDIMKEIQKEPVKLEMWKLDYVLHYYLNDAKVDLKPQELFKKYISGKPEDIKDISVYCIKDTDSCHDLNAHLNIITKAIKMASVCLVPLEYIFIRGQGIKVFSLIANECKQAGLLIPMPIKAKTKEEEKYEGAVVLPPKSGIYYDPVVVLDYNSLYPNCQIAWNISHDTKIINPEFGNLPNKNYYEISYIDYDGTQKTCKYVQADDPEDVGIIPKTCRRLLDARKQVKKLMKDEKDPFMKNILDCMQWAYKITCNSVYGQTGAGTSAIYDKDIAASTTAQGRKMLMLAQRVGESFENVTCIYGDTDSNFYLIKNLDPELPKIEKLKIAERIGFQISEAVNKAIGKEGIMNFAYEKVLSPLFLASKKRYYGSLYADPINSPEFYNKVSGLSVTRRNYCKFLRELLQEILDRLMASDGKSIVTEIKEYIRYKLDELINGKVPLEALAITVSLRENYANAGSMAQCVVAEKMRQRGETVNTNDRIAYCFKMVTPEYNTLGKPKAPKVCDIAEEIGHMKEFKLMYDPEIYIQNQIRKPLVEILEFIMDDPEELLDEAINKVWKIKYSIYGEPVKAKRKKGG